LDSIAEINAEKRKEAPLRYKGQEQREPRNIGHLRLSFKRKENTLVIDVMKILGSEEQKRHMYPRSQF
jgi:hypothetical protein